MSLATFRQIAMIHGPNRSGFFSFGSCLHAELPRTISKEDLLKDEWIQKVIAGLPTGTQADPG